MALSPTHSHWAVAGAFASLCFAGCGLIVGYLSKLGVNEMLIVGGMFFAATLLGIFPAYRGTKFGAFSIQRTLVGTLVIGISAYLGNILLVRSILHAPNPGYPSAVIGTQIVLVSVCGAIWFKRRPTTRSILGMGLSVIGLAMVAI